MNSLKNILTLAILIFINFGLFGQNQLNVSNDVFGRRIFVKNSGQYDATIPKNINFDYAYIKDDEQVFFNKQGVTYLLQKKYPITHSQKEAMERGEKLKLKPSKKAFVNVSWENANPNVIIEVSDKQDYYQSFGDEKYKSDCYKKITYKNVYNNIDIEYLFTNEQEDGIKYNVILHPGANVDDIKIKYSGDINKIIIKDGNIVIKTPVLDMMELIPVSYQEGKSIESSFKINNNLVSFNLANYDSEKTLVIDPWVVNIALATNNYGFDIDYDYLGNLYVYGGSGPFLISKYSTTGTLLWTFMGAVPSISWLSNPGDNYPGNFIVDKVTGKTYTGQGFNNQSGTRIVRLDVLGFYDNFISTSVIDWEELWDMGYRCSDGAVFGLGGSTVSNMSAGVLNTTTGFILPQNFTGLSELFQDVVSHAIDPTGNVFILYASAGSIVNNQILKINSSFNGNDWMAPSQYTSFIESYNKNFPGVSLSVNSNGFNALAANSNFLYYYDGFNLAAYNKLTGAQLGFTTIAGQNLKEQGGIAVDECNNVYVGGIGVIHCFNFNGTTFTPSGSIPVATVTTDKYVTDIKLGSGSSELFVCGNGFAGTYSAINSLSCSSSVAISVTLSTIGINNTTAIATLTTAAISPLITYTWVNSSNLIVSQTNNSTSLTNTVTNLPDGTYTVLVQINAPCGMSNTFTFSMTSAFSQVAAICIGEALAPLPTTSLGGITGVWSPVMNNLATTLYTFTPNPGQNASISTMTIVVNPLTIPVFTQIAPICSGELLALPTTSANGISGVWSPVINNLATTTYMFTPNIGQCATTTTMTIVVNPIPVLSFVANVTSGCMPLTVIFTNTTIGGAVNNCSWNFGSIGQSSECDQATYTYQNQGIYDVTLTASNSAGCSAVFTINDLIEVFPKPDAEFSLTPSITDVLDPVCTLTNESIGATSYLWNFQDGSSSTLTNVVHVFPETPNANYNVTLLASTIHGCVDSVSYLFTVKDVVIFYIPNTFTPDGNELNNIFRPVYTSGIDPSGFKMQIFNRWGEIVFETRDINVGWDGTYNSVIVQDGTYTWTLAFKETMSDKRHAHTGNVNVIR
jgi:gliding motility-associated-like protein